MHPDALADLLLDVTLDSDPVDASLYGLPGRDDLLPDLSAAAQSETAQRFAGIAADAGLVEREGLSEREIQTLDFVTHTAADFAAVGAVPTLEWTITDMFVAPVPALLSYLPRVPHDTVDRAEGYLARLAALPHYVAQVGERNEEGLAAGRPPVARLVRSAVAHLDRVLAVPGIGLRRDAPAGWPQARDLGAEQEPLIEAVVPALQAYRDLLSGPVLTAARDDDHAGLSELPDGDRFYGVLSRHHTSTSRTPEDLHATGIRICSELEAEFAELGERVLGTSDVVEIFARLRDDPALRYGDAAEMVTQARAAVSRAEAAAPDWFGAIPETPCLVEPVPDVDAAGAPPAFYLPPAVDGSRQGTYFINTSDPGERFRHTCEAFAFHEAVPGHHFQLTVALQIQGIPLARRLLRDTACAEGWGLYSERLADEMGLYSSDLTRLGMLSADAWRASRLVVDTGLHALGWTRARAVRWFVDHTPVALREVESEVDRYIAYPGQALSYMVGRLEIQRLRTESATTLGQAFDLKAFHDVVLDVGPLPLAVLASTIGRWTEAQKPG